MYRPCYAPVFAPSSGMDCAMLRMRMAFLIAFLIIVLLMTLGNKGIMCMIRRAGYRMRHCAEGNTDPSIDIGFTLNRWIHETPLIRDAIIWRPDGSRVLPYSTWSQEDKDLLAQLYNELKESSSAGISETPSISTFRYYEEGRGDRGNRILEIGYDVEIVKRTFYAYVAQSLLVEVENLVPWRLSGLSRDHLPFLFDSIRMYSWSTTLRMHVFKAEQGMATPGDPGHIYQWLRENSILHPGIRETIVTMLEWCRGMTHDIGLLNEMGEIIDMPGSRDGNFAHWQYEGMQPTERTLRGTTRGTSSEARHWTHGCQGTTGFLRCLMRTVNIPVKREDGCSHAIPYFLADHTFISHGDDPYTLVMREYTPQIPMSEILLSDRELDGFFADCDHVGSGVHRAVARLLPDQLIAMRCRDLESGVSLTSGEVYAFFGDYISVAEIERMNVIAHLDAEIARRGGCSGLI